MLIYLEGHGYKYEIEQTAIMLLPHMSPRVAEGDRPENGEDHAVSKLLFPDENTVCIETGIFCRDGVFTSFDRLEREGGLVKDERQWIKAVKQLVAASFYGAAVKMLGEKPAWGMLSGVRPAKVALSFYKEGFLREDVVRILIEKYDLSAEKAELCATCAEYSIKAEERTRPGGFSIYVSVPFCPTKCAYCSFVSSVATGSRGGRLIEAYLDALEKEISLASEMLNGCGAICSVYVGGGTPAILEAGQISSLLDAVSAGFRLPKGIEFTFEAGRPDAITAEKLAAARKVGANRVCVNPQSMDDGVLAAVNRRHTADDTVRAFELCRRAGFDIINMDMLYGLPGDDDEKFAGGVERLIALAPENITVHNMAKKRGADRELETGAMRGADYAWRRLTERGYSPYYVYRQKYAAHGLENTGYTLPGRECLYNIVMNEEIHPVISLGAGGMSKIPMKNGMKRMQNPKYPHDYVSARREVMDKKRSFLRAL